MLIEETESLHEIYIDNKVLGIVCGTRVQQTVAITVILCKGLFLLHISLFNL